MLRCLIAICFCAAIGVETVFYEDRSSDTPTASEMSAPEYSMECQPHRHRSYSPTGPCRRSASPSRNTRSDWRSSGHPSALAVVGGGTGSPWQKRETTRELQVPNAGRSRRGSDVSAVSFEHSDPASSQPPSARPFFPSFPGYQ